MSEQIWAALQAHRKATAGRPLMDLFADDPDRFDRFSARLEDMLLDYSKTSLDTTARDLLFDLVRATGVETLRDAMFAGEKINVTEDRAVLHTALRRAEDRPVTVDGRNVMPGVADTRARMARFATGLRSGEIAAVDGRPFTDVVNIGIGGSDLGPVMATLALAPYHDGPRLHYVSNVDGAHIADTLDGLDPARTLVIVASKTFTTIETMTNAQSAKRWMEATLGARAGQHFAAVSSATDRTAAFDIAPDRVFGFEDWVGGRYSVWGPIGLPVMIAVGPDHFEAFLRGGAEMDRHFQEAPLAENLPVLMAIVGIWHNNICGYPTRAVLPYDQRLLRLPAYLQQLDMESNGKRVARDGTPLDRSSGPVVWGEPGTNGQHAFYQLIHQGTEVVPCEFLVAAQAHEHDPAMAVHHTLLLSNCLAQSEALMRGRSYEEALAIVREKGLEDEEMQARHRVFPGNRPSTTLLYRVLDPLSLGRIIALYEHRVFVEGAIWGINSFDQWGVELGKELATAIQPLVEARLDMSGKDGSTAGLLGAVHDLRA
ncbi:glucose-6-phosphate isomerase [Oceanomicrobium pacificus]|uniref:Glucose-6-phosphate isomerase n=1 Tax=Oceanomicrobium pacificus TaxID=2692916 RepID=A0A6B0TIC1_9RHOB|nr:glucose-6-phosphate isomerase [Oceanomicrobium pacificus]MXU64170.1 glucose-6-phosphate isomerase [Oceanomicrobium pacificus]